MTAFAYLRRRITGTLQLLQSHPTCAKEGTRVLSRYESSFVPKRVLIVAKLSRYHFEKMREPNLDESSLKQKLLNRGADVDDMIANHLVTKAVRDKVIKVLTNLNIEYKVINRNHLDLSNFAWADLILPIGGDGTFLLASNMIYDNKKPIMGINSYPKKSEGYLMLPAHYTDRIAEIFEMLKAGHYKLRMKRRIRTILKGDEIWNAPFHMHEKGRVSGSERNYFTVPRFYVDEELQALKGGNLPKERRLPWLALNEVFMGETLSARTSVLLLKSEEHKSYYKTKSSGLCVSTGTGSTSWHKSINSVNPETVRGILKLIDSNSKLSTEEVENICARFNDTLKFESEDSKLCYSIRDMIITDIWPTSKTLRQSDFCKTLTVKSHCYDAGLVIDGGIAVPFNFGTIAVLETHPEDALRTICLPN